MEINKLGLVIGILLVGVLTLSVFLFHKTNELNSVPCWNEVCEEKETDDKGSIISITKEYKYRTERATINEMIFTSQNKFITVGMVKDIVNPSLVKFMEVEEFGEKNVYAKITVKDSDESIIYEGEKGIKPEWMVEK